MCTLWDSCHVVKGQLFGRGHWALDVTAKDIHICTTQAGTGEDKEEKGGRPQVKD